MAATTNSYHLIKPNPILNNFVNYSIVSLEPMANQTIHWYARAIFYNFTYSEVSTFGGVKETVDSRCPTLITTNE